ncbi:unnamed protein product [Rodentolepis nana]|uniref:RING-type domain-containing protein n=1 Tax=Rodentolepis nana TaxID=102285 RepID=A0A0R3TGZ8_RODNA|nr:unnamed protein product [Rodentolepis nana]
MFDFKHALSTTFRPIGEPNSNPETDPETEGVSSSSRSSRFEGGGGGGQTVSNSTTPEDGDAETSGGAAGTGLCRLCFREFRPLPEPTTSICSSPDCGASFHQECFVILVVCAIQDKSTCIWFPVKLLTRPWREDASAGIASLIHRDCGTWTYLLGVTQPNDDDDDDNNDDNKQAANALHVGCTPESCAASAIESEEERGLEERCVQWGSRVVADTGHLFFGLVNTNKSGNYVDRENFEKKHMYNDKRNAITTISGLLGVSAKYLKSLMLRVISLSLQRKINVVKFPVMKN